MLRRGGEVEIYDVSDAAGFGPLEGEDAGSEAGPSETP
jgi:hypothetical protein